jgi:hypothetical protein
VLIRGPFEKFVDWTLQTALVLSLWKRNLGDDIVNSLIKKYKDASHLLQVADLVKHVI